MTIPWMFRLAFGYFVVSVLGGGLYAWLRYHRRHRVPPVIH